MPDFEGIVRQHYEGLYRFALSLSGNEDDAGDLTQEAFRTWARKGHQLQDAAKAKAWLYTTLHRLFLQSRRKLLRFPQHELDTVLPELPTVEPVRAEQLDAGSVVGLLARLDPVFRAPVALFYLEDSSYEEIARVLGVPLGTVKSRIARGLAQLREWVNRWERRVPATHKEQRS